MIPLPQKPKLTKKSGNTAYFEIEALYPGYGVTVGNALRRVLLSSLPGAAITQVKIKNVAHEFSTIDHVKEDVVQIILNLKKLRFRLHSDEPQRISLHVTGEKKVTGKDFTLPSEVELITKDLPIATLTDKKAEFMLEAVIEKGLGYSSAEARAKERAEVGTIFLDALFSPIVRVSFRVENMRVGDRTDYDRLYLELETDGTIDAEEAMRQAAGILKEHFALVENTFMAVKSEKANAQKEEETTEERSSDSTKMDISSLDISTRIVNILANNKIKTVGGLIRKSESSLLELEGMGEAGLQEIKKALKKIGLELKQ